MVSMWKKLFVLGIALAGTLSLGAVCFSERLWAAAATGGNVTGRIGKLVKDDVINLHTTFTPGSVGYGSSGSTNVSMKLLKSGLSNGAETYYSQVTYNNDTWICGGMNSLGTTTPFDVTLFSNDFTTNHTSVRGPDGNYAKVGHVQNKFSNSRIAPYINALVSAYSSNGGYDSEIVRPRIFKTINGNAAGSTLSPTAYVYQQDTAYTSFFVLQGYERAQIAAFADSDLSWNSNYWLEMVYSSSNKTWSYANASGATAGNNIALSASMAVRPFVYLDLSNVVFAISQPNGSGVSVVNAPTTGAPAMNVRLQNGAMHVDFEKMTTSMNGTDTVISKIQKGNDIKLFYHNAVSDVGSDISVLITDSASGQLKYYQKLGTAGSQGSFTFSTSTLASGSYQVHLVNEESYSDNGPRHSSALSNVFPLEVLDPLAVSVTPVTTLEYSKNVNPNDTVATISATGGVAPITYKLISDTSVSGHANDYEKFQIAKDGAGNLVIQVKNTALNAGDYYLKVNAIDDNQDPTDGLNSNTVHIHVAKTSPNLQFTNSAQVNKVIGDAAFRETFTHDNTDTYTMSYSSSLSNVAQVSTWNSTDSDVSVTLGSSSGIATISVTIRESDNFKAQTITKTIKVVPKMILSFAPTKSAFAINEVSAAGSIVGTITLTADSADYTYSMGTDPNAPAGSDANNALFVPSITTATPNKTLRLITAQAHIPQGSYKVTIKAEDVYGQVSYVSGTIRVNGTAQSGFDFHDYTNTANILTDRTLTIYYGESNAVLIATGGQSSGSITYALSNGEPTNIIAVDAATGAITINDIGKVKVQASKAADSTYSEALIYMEVEVKPCEQEIAFVQPNKVVLSYDNANGHSFREEASAKIKAGMPNAGDSGVGSITYALSGSGAGIASIDADGTITINPGLHITSKQSFDVTATITDADGHYTSASITKTVDVYPPGSMTWTQTNIPQADNNQVNELVGVVSMSGGTGTYTYSIPAISPDNPDGDYFSIDAVSGEVKIKQVIDHNVLATKLNPLTHRYEMQIVAEVNDNGNVTSEIIIIEIKGAKRSTLDFRNRDAITGEITEVYAPNKNFLLSLTQTIQGTTYRESLQHANPQDVVQLDATNNAQVNVLNANERSIQGSTVDPYYVEAVVPQRDGYEETIIEAPIRIKRAEQQLAFAMNPINTSADIQSLNIAVSGHMDQNQLVYSSSDSRVRANADPNDNNSVIIRPNGQVRNGITITVVAQGDRNYKDAMETATLNIAPQGTQQFTAIFPHMTYGDTDPYRVVISPLGDGSETYTYTVKNTNIVEIDADGNITIHHAGVTDVDVTQTSAGGVIGPYTFTLSVEPKPIIVTIDDKESYVGMAIPTFSADIPANELVGSDTLGNFRYLCVDERGIAVSPDTKAGSYPISGSFTQPNPDYAITVEKGTLTIRQDEADQSWYHLEDQNGNPTTSQIWHQGSVDIVLDQAIGSAGIYDQIGTTPAFANFDKTRVTITQEGESVQNIYFRIDPNGSDPHQGAISLPLQDTIRIDNTKPIIKSIAGVNNDNSAARRILNRLTLGMFFRPGTVITIQAEDVEPSAGIKISGIAKTSYEVKKLDQNGDPIGTSNQVDQSDDTVEVSLSEIGKYSICAVATDNAGNTSNEKCEIVEIKKLDVDVDGDDKPDFNDPDGDGCADTNIKYQDERGQWQIINGDLNNDGIPDYNIDIDGDGNPDLNLDTDQDGKPDINLVNLKEWKPTKCVRAKGEEYSSGVNVKAEINIDTDNDLIPDINIDTDGDFKADINIDQNNNNELDPADFNITTQIKIWTPNKDYTVQKFIYDTQDDLKPYVNVIAKGDELPSLNIDLDGDGLPDINIDADGDGLPETNIDIDGDGIADINLDPDGSGTIQSEPYEIKEWKPSKQGKGNGFTFITMEIDLNPQDDPGSDPDSERPDKEVNGSYYPGDNVGGALTGDASNRLIYVGMGCVSLGLICLIRFKQKQKSN